MNCFRAPLHRCVSSYQVKQLDNLKSWSWAWVHPRSSLQEIITWIMFSQLLCSSSVYNYLTKFHFYSWEQVFAFRSHVSYFFVLFVRAHTHIIGHPTYIIGRCPGTTIFFFNECIRGTTWINMFAIVWLVNNNRAY